MSKLVYGIAGMIILASAVLTVVHFVMCKDTFDRILALEAVGLNMIGAILLYSIAFSRPEFFDGILAFSLLSFIITVFLTASTPGSV